MGKASFVELSITDSSILNFGKEIYNIQALKSKVILEEEVNTEFVNFTPTNTFKFHNNYSLQLKLHKKAKHFDLGVSDLFGFYPIMKKSKNARFNQNNVKDLYSLFNKNNRSNKFIKAIHNLIDNLSNYYFIISDIPNLNIGLNLYNLYTEYPDLISANFTELIDFIFPISREKIKRSNKKRLPILIITLSNPIIANKLRLNLIAEYKIKSQIIVVLN